MAKKKECGPAPAKSKLSLKDHLALFVNEYQHMERGIEKLATVYTEAKADYPAFDDELRSSGVYVSQDFLDALQKIADKKLHPTVFLQSRGFTRLGLMKYEDQEKLVNSGLLVQLDDDHYRVMRLCSMSDDVIMQVVTSQGRVRKLDEQLRYMRQQKEAGSRKESKRDRIARRVRRTTTDNVQDYVRTDDGVRFTNPERVWKLTELRQLLSVWMDGKVVSK